MPTFWETTLLLSLKTARLCTNFFSLKIFAKYCLDPEAEREPKLFQSRNRINNKSLQFHNTIFFSISHTVVLRIQSDHIRKIVWPSCVMQFLCTVCTEVCDRLNSQIFQLVHR
jgi:hypothetical protein